MIAKLEQRLWKCEGENKKEKTLKTNNTKFFKFVKRNVFDLNLALRLV
jgi:hypothetical protein